MFLGILTLITALTISAVAIYYSVAGLVAIFAAAAIPIMIMGGALEIGKLVTAVWLHRYWKQSTWWLKTYLTTAVIVLMFITSMGIFGFLSKAHIEQTASASEGMAQIERIDAELERQQQIIARAEQRIEDASNSVGENNQAIQAQIDIEQERIDSAYARVQPAIDEQNRIIEDTRATDARRTEPFEQQLTGLETELQRLNDLASEYEQRLQNLQADDAAVERILNQITEIENNIVRTTNLLQSTERSSVQQGQAIIGVQSDGLFGGNTRRALASWVEAQRTRISELQIQAAQLGDQSQLVVNQERQRLTSLIEDIRGPQTDAVKSRQLELLATIDEVRANESPRIQAARDEIARIRASADAQIAQSQSLIQSLRESLTIGTDEDVEAVIEQQTQRINTANNTIDNLTEEKYALQAEYRKLEAEVGPIKYLAEFIYGDTADQNLLEEAVRWVILVIIFVFDPLAVLLLIASQHTFGLHRPVKKTDDSGEHHRLESENFSNDVNDTTDNVAETPPLSPVQDIVESVVEQPEDQKKSIELSEELRQARTLELEAQENDENWTNAKRAWKDDHPDLTLKKIKESYIQGKIDRLPWEDYIDSKKNYFMKQGQSQITRKTNQ